MDIHPKKQRNLTDEEREDPECPFGDLWTNAGFDPRHRVVVSVIPGDRDGEAADKLIADIKERSDGHIPLFTSDERRDFKTALLNNYGVLEEIKPTGKPGRPRKPRLLPHSELKYAQIEKQKKKGSVVKTERKIVFGDKEAIEKIIEESPVSKTINTSFMERQNLTFREGNARLSRKSLRYSKVPVLYIFQLYIFLAYYHLIRPHWGLRIEAPQGRRRWQERTPFMSAGKTNRIWTWRGLTSFHIPPGSLREVN